MPTIGRLWSMQQFSINRQCNFQTYRGKNGGQIYFQSYSSIHWCRHWALSYSSIHHPHSSPPTASCVTWQIVRIRRIKVLWSNCADALQLLWTTFANGVFLLLFQLLPLDCADTSAWSECWTHLCNLEIRGLWPRLSLRPNMAIFFFGKDKKDLRGITTDRHPNIPLGDLDLDPQTNILNFLQKDWLRTQRNLLSVCSL